MIDRDAVTNAIEILRPESFTTIVIAWSLPPFDVYLKNTTDRFVDGYGRVAQNGTTGRSRRTILCNLAHQPRGIGSAYRTSRAYCRTKFIQRELIKISTEIVHDSYEDTTDVFELLDKAEQNLFNIADKNLRTSYSEINNLLSATIKEIDEARKHEDALTGCPSGFSALDRLTGGWQKSDLIIVAARPSMGKTAFTLSFARNAAVEFKRCCRILLEMSAQQIVKRLISAETEIVAEKIIKGNLAEHEMVQLVKLSGRLGEVRSISTIHLPSTFLNCAQMPSFENATRYSTDRDRLSAINDRQRFKQRRQTANREISQISRSLKSIAKELNIPIIALSQLSRKVEDRGWTKRPMLSDLRESGSHWARRRSVCFSIVPNITDLMWMKAEIPPKASPKWSLPNTETVHSKMCVFVSSINSSNSSTSTIIICQRIWPAGQCPERK